MSSVPKIALYGESGAADSTKLKEDEKPNKAE